MLNAKSLFIALQVTLLPLTASGGAAAEEGVYEGTPNVEEVTFKAKDGVTVFADLITSGDDPAAPLIILYHQAGGSARGEYENIVPRLVTEGYHVLAVDQRSGSDYFGAPNRTASQFSEEFGYCEAYPDLVAALDYAVASEFSGPRFIWGSSYSAGLALNLGVERGDDLAGVLSFSPAAAGPMAECSSTPVVKYLKVPALALRPLSEMKNEAVKQQLTYFESLNIETYVSENGVHGSSMLNPERIKADPEATWAVVLDFLARNTPKVDAAPTP